MHPHTNRLSFSNRLCQLRGFTAIELMVVVSILAILAVIAAPNFVLLIESMRANNAMDDVQGVLMYARSEAVRNRSNVVVRLKPGVFAAVTIADVSRILAASNRRRAA